jgi:fibronectin type 3 domain-containing protein
MMVANESGFGGVWETYRFSREWSIPEGDGAKTVYARFRDANGSESPSVSDAIELDTYAAIDDISLSPQPYVYEPGATVHIGMSVAGNEPSGEARIAIEGYAAEIRLTDDGRGGDPTASDGVYELDFTFPSDARGTDLAVVGSFTDRAGNDAQPFEAAFTVDFTDIPDPVQLVGVQDSTTDGITIRWTASNDEHFSRYAVYRDTEPGVDEDPLLLVEELFDRGRTVFPDGGLTEGETYYYRIFVVNDLEESSGSNELAASTADRYPDPVLLDTLSSIGSDRVTLTWSENPNTDFDEYRIYRSISPGVDLTATLVATINERQRTFYDDTGLDMGSFTYYYRVYVFDRSGKYTRSNEVTTPN